MVLSTSHSCTSLRNCGVRTPIHIIPCALHTTSQQRRGLTGPGALSVVSTFIQAGGQVLIFIFQLLEQNPPSTWVSNIFAFLEQTTLLLMILGFYLQRERHRRLQSQRLLTVDEGAFDDQGSVTDTTSPTTPTNGLA
mmetsp:Transcript_55444/g.130846  ORF Transcript_55444/g.130846 Transcript_55444/m.130846 type:complete len:137 (+) Transcript_55444:129-539(+)